MSALDEKIHYGLLGPVTAWYDGSEIDLGGRKHRTALAVLLLRAGRLVPHHDLIDALWGDDPPTTAANLVHKYLSGLRRALPAGHGLVVLPGSGYLLRVPPGNLDLHRFDEHQRERASTAPPPSTRRPQRSPSGAGRRSPAPTATTSTHTAPA